MNGRTAVVLLVAACLVGGTFLVGCEPQRTLVPTDKSYVADVPVPTTFKLDPKYSTDFATQGAQERYNSYYYTGRAYFLDVEKFYKRMMPVDGWQLAQDVGAAGRKTLYFKKTGLDTTGANVPTCIVTIFARDQYATAIQIVRTER